MNSYDYWQLCHDMTYMYGGYRGLAFRSPDLEIRVLEFLLLNLESRFGGNDCRAGLDTKY
jgi:hypothetical protein